MRQSLILVPGLLCDARLWRDQCRGLKDRVDIAVADIGQDDRIEAMADRLLREAPDHFALAGHALGGRVALAAYAAAPERVTRLALIGAGPSAAPDEAASPALADMLHDAGVAQIGERLLFPAMHPERRDGLLADLKAMLARADPDAVKRQLHALRNRADVSDLLPLIACPTLLLCGKEDRYASPACHEAMAARIPGARLDIIEEAGHMAPMEAPDAVTAALSAWLGL
jgi:pimeloyl-ACP methyl ester carboxylesterase